MLMHSMTTRLFRYYCYHNYNIIIINISSCPIATELPSFMISQLSAAVRAYFNLGISAATRKAYTAGLCKYITFCMKINQPPIPAYENTLLLFVTHLAQQKLSYAMIQVYLSAVRYSHITTSESTTLRTPKLNYVLKGIRKTCHKPSTKGTATYYLSNHGAPSHCFLKTPWQLQRHHDLGCLLPRLLWTPQS